jgi:hypothetical protein
VTGLARQRGVCRQALYRQAHAVAVAVEGTQAAQRLQAARQRLAELQARCAALERQAQGAVLVDGDRRSAFAATAQALGVRLSAARALRPVVLGDAAPSSPPWGGWRSGPPARPAPPSRRSTSTAVSAPTRWPPTNSSRATSRC